MKYTVNKNIKEDEKISIALMSSFAVLTIQYLILVTFNLIGTNTGQMVQLASKGIVGLFYLMALPPVLRRNKIKFIGIYFVAIFLFIFNYAFFNENWVHLKTIIFPLFFTGLPSLIYAYSLNNWDVLMEVMRKTTKIVFVAGTIIGGLVFTGSSSVGTYSMSLSYYMLLPAIIYMNDFIDRKSIKNGILLIISMIIIMALGSRGAIMCFGVFTILKLFRNMKGITLKKMLVYIILFSIILGGIIFFKEIIEFLYNILLKFGINSRTLKLFLRDKVHLSGRDRIYENIMQEIMSKPFIGLGLAGDRTILYGRNAYVHNIFIEIFANFGIIIGMFIITILLYIIVRSLFVKDIKKYNMIIIWFSLGFINLLVSSSYLIDFKFWILLGLMTKALRDKYATQKNSGKRQKNETNFI